jgi:anti-sigma factor NepR-like protein
MRPSSNLRETKSFSEWTIRADDADARIARAIRICVGNHLRGMYGDLLNQPIPPKLADLLRRLDRRTALEPSLREAGKRDREYYLAEAEFCAELAESMKRPDYKDSDRWLKTAQEWRDLAEQAGTGSKVTQHRH